MQEALQTPPVLSVLSDPAAGPDEYSRTEKTTNDAKAAATDDEESDTAA